MTPERNTKDHSRVASMFGRIASGYDAANRVLSLGIDSLWRRRLVSGVQKRFEPGTEYRILDLAAGTLDVSLALVRSNPGVWVVAADFCLPMLLAGERKLSAAGSYEQSRVSLVCANGLALPLRDSCVDAVTVSFGLRNMVPREKAIGEAYRVLKKGGVFHVLEFGSAKGRIFGGLYNLYLTRVLPWIGGLITKDRAAYTYLANTVIDFPEAPQLGEDMRNAGFTDVSWNKLWGGIVYLHTGVKRVNPSDDGGNQ